MRPEHSIALGPNADTMESMERRTYVQTRLDGDEYGKVARIAAELAAHEGGRPSIDRALRTLVRQADIRTATEKYLKRNGS